MKRIRIGKDISMRWEITTDGVAIPLDGRDLTVEIKSPAGIENNIPYRIDGNILIMTYYGYEQKRTGEYSITLWEKKGKPGQNVVDVIRAFELVKTSQEEYDFVGGDLQIESVDLGTENFDILTEGGYRAINIDTLQAEALDDSVNIKGKTYSNESFTITLPKANLDVAGVMSADDKQTLQDHGNSISQLESTTSWHSNAISKINAKLYEHTESINAKITTDRIEDGAVTSEKIATSAFDSTLSVSGKIAPANVVGERLTELDEKVDALALGKFYGYFPDSISLPTDIPTPGYAYVGLDNPYKIWNFNGKSWSDSGTYIDMNDADEEDITRNADGELQFKDRAYGDGMGYVILRKNKTFAEQVTEENTIYEIRYDFVLDDTSINLPYNCVLKFTGGHLSNGVIVGNNTLIQGAGYGALEKIVLDGAYSNADCNISWWGAKISSQFDNSDVIEYAIKSNIYIIKVSGVYGVSRPIFTGNKTHFIVGASNYLYNNVGFAANDNFSSVIIQREGSDYVVDALVYHADHAVTKLFNLAILCNSKTKYGILGLEGYSGIDLHNIMVMDASFIGVMQYGCEYIKFDSVAVRNSYAGIVVSNKKIDEDDIFSVTNIGAGQNNLVNLEHCRVTRCSYGFFIIGGSNTNLTNCESAECSIMGLVGIKSNLIIYNYYSERDGLCADFHDKSGNVYGNISNTTTCSELVDKNLDGIKIKSDLYGRYMYFRSVFYFAESKVNINGAFISYYVRSKSTTGNVSVCDAPSVRDSRGVDSIFIVNKTSLILRGVVHYSGRNGSPENSRPWHFVLSYAKTESIGDVPSNVHIENNDNTKNDVYFVNSWRQSNASAKFPSIFANIKTGVTSSDYNNRFKGKWYGNRNARWDIRGKEIVDCYENIPLYKVGAIKTTLLKSEMESIFGATTQVLVTLIVKAIGSSGSQRLGVRCLAYNGLSYVGRTPLIMQENATPVSDGILILKGILHLNLQEVEYDRYDFTFDFPNLTDNYFISDLLFSDLGSDIVYYDTNGGILSTGNTSDRPIASKKGQMYFDETINKPIYWTGTKWVDATGTDV